MANKQEPDEPMDDPVTRVVKMARAGETNKITTSMLREAEEYSRQKDLERERAQQDEGTIPS